MLIYLILFGGGELTRSFYHVGSGGPIQAVSLAASTFTHWTILLMSVFYLFVSLLAWLPEIRLIEKSQPGAALENCSISVEDWDLATLLTVEMEQACPFSFGVLKPQL